MTYRYQTPEEVEKDTGFSLFTTMRYTTDRKREVTQEMIPLWTYHLRRLREAHAYFVVRDGLDRWGDWPGDEAIWGRVKEKLEDLGKGDYRVLPVQQSFLISQLTSRSAYYYITVRRLRYKPRPLLPMLVSYSHLTNHRESELILQVYSSCFQVEKRAKGAHCSWIRMLRTFLPIVPVRSIRGCTRRQTGQYTTKQQPESVSSPFSKTSEK